MNEEAIKVLRLIRKLNFEEYKRFFYMLAGANVVAQKEKKTK